MSRVSSLKHLLDRAYIEERELRSELAHKVLDGRQNPEPVDTELEKLLVRIDQWEEELYARELQVSLI